MNPLELNLDLLRQFDPDTTPAKRESFRSIFPDLSDKLISDIYGFAYRRGEITLETRHLISIGVLCALGGCENQLQFQLKAALNLGIPIEQIREVFIQVSVFAGNARAINAACVLQSLGDGSVT